MIMQGVQEHFGECTNTLTDQYTHKRLFIFHHFLDFPKQLHNQLATFRKPLAEQAVGIDLHQLSIRKSVHTMFKQKSQITITIAILVACHRTFWDEG